MGLIRAGELPAVLFPIYSVSLHSCCGGYMATCSRLLQQQQGRQRDGVCVRVCGCVNTRVCVWDCKVIPCITRTPATLHNRPNKGTLTAFFLQVCRCPSFLYFSFPSFHQTPATLTFWQPFRSVMSAWRTLKCFVWHHFLLRISQASNVACELRTATGSSWNEHTSGTQTRSICESERLLFTCRLCLLF